MELRPAWITRLILAAITLLASPELARAQTGERLVLGVSAARAEMRMVGFEPEAESLSGPLFGVEGRASLWWMHARGEYRQGRLEREGPEGSTRVVTARAGLGIHPFPWLAITAGPSIWTVDTDEGDRRITRWRVEAHGSSPLIPGVATGFATIGGSVAGTGLDWGVPFRSAGGEAGILLGGLSRPMWARLGYRMDREYLSDGSWQAVETAYLTVGVSVPNVGGSREE
jgi:hypothetical protein